jgi:predicted amidohydrolase YtcJ
MDARLGRPIWGAVQLRRSRSAIDNSVIGPIRPLAVDEALKAITVNETRQIGFDDRASTFEPGTEADPTILESDPYKTDPE